MPTTATNAETTCCAWAYHCPTCKHLLMFCTCAKPFAVSPDAPLLIELTTAAFAICPPRETAWDGPDPADYNPYERL